MATPKKLPFDEWVQVLYRVMIHSGFWSKSNASKIIASKRAALKAAHASGLKVRQTAELLLREG